MSMKANLSIFQVEMSKRRHILQFLGESEREFSRRVVFPKYDIRDSVTRRISKIPSMNNGRDSVGPRHGYSGTLYEHETDT